MLYALGIIEEPGCKAPATCLPDGRYAPVQCKGDIFTGRYSTAYTKPTLIAQVLKYSYNLMTINVTSKYKR